MMKLEMRGQMRLEQKMKLAPQMIQSMQILQLPILALQERIEQELNNNPVLEIAEQSPPEDIDLAGQQAGQSKNRDEPAPHSGTGEVEDFTRIERLDDEYNEYMTQAGGPPSRRTRDQTDRKLEAIKNTAAPAQSLHDYLCEQWGLVDATESVKKAGARVIDYINDRGYLTTRLELLYSKDKSDYRLEDLKLALRLIQDLEPAGVGARDLKECLLIQIDQKGENMTFERRLVAEFMDLLIENRLPEIAKKMKCSLRDINNAITNLSKLDTSPGLQVGRTQNHPITADVIVEPADSPLGYLVRLANADLPALRISSYYAKMANKPDAAEKTRKFLQDNIRSARWIIDAIEQRKNTLLKVTRAIVKHQKDFFDKGQLYLRPLPMAKIADDIGVHLATVSRAVADKYVQCPRGVLPLRKFFSGGIPDNNGKPHSWEAIRAKLQQIVNAEDKTKPLSDEQIRRKLADAGIKNLARRTVAKYRCLLNIPAARMRKKY